MEIITQSKQLHKRILISLRLIKSYSWRFISMKILKTLSLNTDIIQRCRNPRIFPFSTWPHSALIPEGSRSFWHLTGHFLNSRHPEKKENFIKVTLDQLSTKQVEDMKMVTPAVKIFDQQLFIHKKSILSGILENVVVTRASGISLDEGVFIRAQFSECNSQHIIPLGTLKDVRFLSFFRFKLWWMAQKMGKYAKEIPIETQFLLLESKVGSLPRKGIDCGSCGQMSYTVFLPLTEGPFKASLQGNEKDELELCFESGDPAITTSYFTHSLFITTGTDPFRVIKDEIRAMELHLHTFHHRDEKKMPRIIDCFGWCTWDAFYIDVSAEGVEDFLSYTCLQILWLWSLPHRSQNPKNLDLTNQTTLSGSRCWKTPKNSISKFLLNVPTL